MYKGQKFLSEQCVCCCIWLDDYSKDNFSKKQTLLVTCHNCVFVSLESDWIRVILFIWQLWLWWWFLVYFPSSPLDLCCLFWYNLSKMLSYVITSRGPSNSIWHFNNTHLNCLLCLHDFREICISSYTPKQLEKKDSWNRGIFN